MVDFDCAAAGKFVRREGGGENDDGDDVEYEDGVMRKRRCRVMSRGIGFISSGCLRNAGWWRRRYRNSWLNLHLEP